MRRIVIALVLALLTAPARAAVQSAPATDGLGFPIYPGAVTYAVFALNVQYLAGKDVRHVLRWYQNASRRRWTVESEELQGNGGSASLSFTDATGTHRVEIRSYSHGVTISEQLDLAVGTTAGALARGRRLQGSTDPLGVPLYPHRTSDQSLVLGGENEGLVTYATLDPFDTVERWFNARLPGTFSKSYSVSQKEDRMQTFHGGALSVTITHRAKDGGFTVIGVQRIR